MRKVTTPLADGKVKSEGKGGPGMNLLRNAKRDHAWSQERQKLEYRAEFKMETVATKRNNSTGTYRLNY